MNGPRGLQHTIVRTDEVTQLEGDAIHRVGMAEMSSEAPLGCDRRWSSHSLNVEFSLSDVRRYERICHPLLGTIF